MPVTALLCCAVFRVCKIFESTSGGTPGLGPRDSRPGLGSGLGATLATATLLDYKHYLQSTLIFFFKVKPNLKIFDKLACEVRLRLNTLALEKRHTL